MTIIEIIQTINEKIRQQDFGGLDDLLSSLDVTRMEGTEIIAWARSSFVVRRNLPNWTAFIRRAHENLTALGVDADLLLKGLL